MAKTNQYLVAENWGKGFIETGESTRFSIAGYPGNVWKVPAHNKQANLWIGKVLGTIKTKDEAQTLVDAEVTAAQTAWDALSTEQQAINGRPEDIILEE